MKKIRIFNFSNIFVTVKDMRELSAVGRIWTVKRFYHHSYLSENVLYLLFTPVHGTACSLDNGYCVYTCNACRKLLLG